MVIIKIKKFQCSGCPFFHFSALFLVEAGNEKLWLWQGWWPDVGHEANDTNMSTGSGIIRWHAERREAMRTLKEFQRSKFSKLTNQARPPMELVWAGHEPLEFTNLFPSWTHHIDIQTLNYKVSHTVYYFVQNNLNHKDLDLMELKFKEKFVTSSKVKLFQKFSCPILEKINYDKK